jgi:hypothetical protein
VEAAVLIDHISEAALSTWHRWLTIFAIVLPIFGGFFGLAAYWVGKRIEGLQTAATDLRIQQANARVDYFDVAKLNAIGLSGSVMPPLEEHSELSRLLSPHVTLAPKFFWDCAPQAMADYDAAISLNDKFPFSYFYKGGCGKKLGSEGWQTDIEVARRIFRITTKFPGHHPNHDEVLHLIETNDFGVPL